MAAAGFALFSPSAALGDVAEQFGHLGEGGTIAEQAGLPGSVLGGGLAVIRLSGLLALPFGSTGRSGRAAADGPDLRHGRPDRDGRSGGEPELLVVRRGVCRRTAVPHRH
jgi:hypothetical protein